MSKLVDKTMLIGDSEIDLFIHRRFLELCNFSKELISYKSAEAAFDSLRNLNGDSPPNIIFLDLNMLAVDGFSFLNLFAGLLFRAAAQLSDLQLSRSYRVCF